MKMFVSLMLTLSLVVTNGFFCSGIVVDAEGNVDNTIIIEDVDWSEQGFANVKATYRQSKNSKQRGLLAEPTVELDYVISKTNDQIHFERVGNYGYYYINGELDTIFEYGINNLARSVTVPNEYLVVSPGYASGWTNFQYGGNETWVVRRIKDRAADVVVSLFTSAITGALGIVFVGQFALDVVSTVASELNNAYALSQMDVEDFYAVNIEYISQNYQCNILHWYGLRVLQYTNANYNTVTGVKSSFARNNSHYWYSNPYDQTQPSACRVLVNSFGY